MIWVKTLGTEPFLVSLGNRVWISVDVVFHTHDGGTWVFKEKHPDLLVRGPIVIEDNCFIGRGVQLLPNIRIGANSIIGAGSVVINNIPANTLASGVPARSIGSLSKYEEKCLANWKEQKPPQLNINQKGWYHSKSNQEMMRKHLTKLFFNHDKAEKTAPLDRDFQSITGLSPGTPAEKKHADGMADSENKPER